MLILSLHRVRKRRSLKRKWVLFDEEFPTGEHEVHYHESCFLRQGVQELLEIYGNRLPDEPKNVGHRR